MKFNDLKLLIESTDAEKYKEVLNPDIAYSASKVYTDSELTSMLAAYLVTYGQIDAGDLGALVSGGIDDELVAILDKEINEETISPDSATANTEMNKNKPALIKTIGRKHWKKLLRQRKKDDEQKIKDDRAAAIEAGEAPEPVEPIEMLSKDEATKLMKELQQARIEKFKDA